MNAFKKQQQDLCSCFRHAFSKGSDKLISRLLNREAKNYPFGGSWFGKSLLSKCVIMIFLYDLEFELCFSHFRVYNLKFTFVCGSRYFYLNIIFLLLVLLATLSNAQVSFLALHWESHMQCWGLNLVKGMQSKCLTLCTISLALMVSLIS